MCKSPGLPLSTELRPVRNSSIVCGFEARTSSILLRVPGFIRRGPGTSGARETVTRLLWEQKTLGSTPGRPTRQDLVRCVGVKFAVITLLNRSAFGGKGKSCWGYSSAGRASVWQAEGPEFESPYLHVDPPVGGSPARLPAPGDTQYRLAAGFGGINDCPAHDPHGLPRRGSDLRSSGGSIPQS